MKKLFQLRMIFACLAGSALSEPPRDLGRSQVTRLGPAQGLLEENVYSITETPDGYLWLATRDGLLRFDGQKVRSFHPEDSSGFVDNRLETAAVLGERLWIGARDYVGSAGPN